MSDQLQVLSSWVQQQLNDSGVTLQPLYGDASQRRYYRVQNHGKSLVIMDASCNRDDVPAFELTDVPAFIAIDEALLKLGLNAPKIYAQDIKQGFLILEDFADQQLLPVLNTKNADNWYRRACDDLLVMQQCQKIDGYSIPDFDRNAMTAEWKIFTKWFLQEYQQIDLKPHQLLLNNVLQLLLHNNQQQPHVFMHRDYHSRNLMILPKQQLGILDFQGAKRGPITYDLVSLLKDCYIDWPIEQVQQWALALQSRLLKQVNAENISKQQFLRWFDLTGLQRHLKVLGQFVRKAIVANDQRYMADVPRVKNYVLDVCRRYSELNDFLRIL